MITAPKISINIPPLRGSSSSHPHNVSNVSISDSGKAPISTGITKIIKSNQTPDPVVYRNNSSVTNLEVPSMPSAVNIMRRHSFRKEQPISVAPSVNFTHSTSTLNNFNQNLSHLEGSIEQAILRSTVPINLSETEETTALGHRGIWANRSEIVNWNGPVPIDAYRLNDDPNPEVIHKVNNQPIEYNQDIQVRYLRPPTPPPPGDLIIKQENAPVLPPAPPQIIRQLPPRPITPEPLIIREAPPEPPAVIPRKIITIQNQQQEAPPRKVIIERLPPLPPKPQPVIIERWLPYQHQKRRVIYEASNMHVQNDKPRNIIIQWEAASPVVKKNIKYLGVENAEPREYMSRYGHSLRRTSELPSFVRELESDGQNVYKKIVHEASNSAVSNELEGDIEALRYLDGETIEREGLNMYRHYCTK